MDIYIFFSIISILIYLYGSFSYIKDIKNGLAIPHPFSWIGWSIIIFINLYGLIESNGFSLTVLPVFIRLFNVFFCSIIGFILIKKIKINYFDIICLILSFSCLFIFYYFGSTKAIIISIIIDLFLLLPTIKKVYLNPKSETLTTWITTGLMAFFLILSIKNNTIENTLYWIIVMFENFLVGFFVFYKKLIK